MHDSTIKIKAVHETHNIQDTNKFLKLGWKLLNTAGGTSQESQAAYIKYSLGWDQESDPVKPKDY